MSNTTTKQLRKHIPCIGPCCENKSIMLDAADEIEKLEAEIDRLNRAA